MNRMKNLRDKLRGLTNAIARYPLTAAFLLAAAVWTAVSIQTSGDYEKQILTCAVGAVLCAALQAFQERFLSKALSRLLLMGCGVVLTAGYYLVLRSVPEPGIEFEIRTAVALGALFFAYLWVPVIKSKVSFNESFLAAFKAFFHALLYAVVLFAGCALVIAALDTLIVNVSEKAYLHTSNLVFVLFAPLFFLSLIPVYPGKRGNDTEDQEEAVKKASSCPKFLEVLVSYIIIPLTGVYTLILLLYIVRNIRGAFWTNNLLEPLLVSYAIIVIVVCFLSSRLENQFAKWFRLIFPKVLVPIVLFQIAASVLSLRETGMTHTRYFVILFGLFAAASGFVMSVAPVRKNGVVAAMLIVFSIVSIIPPVDAFTVSYLSQKAVLETTLRQNGMLENNTIKPKSDLSDSEKKKIVSSVQYLERMEYLDRIDWMPDVAYNGFVNTFGFYEFNLEEKTNRSVNVFVNATEPIAVAGYDVLARTFVSLNENEDPKICDLEKAGKHYALRKEKNGEKFDLVLRDGKEQEVIRFDTSKIFSRYSSYAEYKPEISLEDATFSTENNKAKLTIVVQNASLNTSLDRPDHSAEFFVLVGVK